MADSDLILRKADELVRDVRQMVNDKPADRAALRHSLGHIPEDTALDVHRIVVPHLPYEYPDDATERAFYAVPGYIAAQTRQGREDEKTAARKEPRDDARRQNLGESLARAVHGKGLNGDSIEARLQLLARQDLDGIYRQLPRLVLQLRADQVRIDWALLITDLRRWGSAPRQVAKEWMQSYYRTSERLIAEKKRKDADAHATPESEDK